MRAPWRKGVGGHRSFAVGPVRRGGARWRGRAASPAAELLEGRALLSFVATAYSAGSNPVAVAVGDFNGDGRADVALANNTASAGTVSVRLSNPDGSLAPLSGTTAVPVPTTQVLATDLNGDGKPDLVTAGQGFSGNVILNTGNGTLGAAALVGNNFGHNLISVTAADFTGDGKPELVFGGTGFVNNQQTATTQGFFEIEQNNGDGTITTFPWLGLGTTGHVPVALATADVNRDGFPDVAVVNQDQNNLGVYFVTPLDSNPAVGLNVTLKGNYGTPNNPTSVAAGDLNGDGLPDFVVGGGDGRLGVILGKSDGSIQSDRIFNNGVGGSVVAVGLADFNGDGRQDVAALHDFGPGSTGGGVELLLGKGDGTFQAPLLVRTAATGSTSGLAVGDLNGDGRPDLVTANPSSNTVSVMLNDGSWPALLSGGGGPVAAAAPAATTPVAPVTTVSPAAVSAGASQVMTALLPFTPGDDAAPWWTPVTARHRKAGLIP